MPAKKEYPTGRKGVFYILVDAPGGGQERCYYIRFKKKGKLVVEKAGRAGSDRMTAPKADRLRAAKIEGRIPTNKERRQAEAAEREAETNRWTIGRLWSSYLDNRPGLKGKAQDESRYRNYIKPTFEDREPKELVALDVDRLRLGMLKKGKSPQTTKLTLALLRRIIRYGVDKGLCDPLPFRIEFPKVSNEVTEDLTADQINNLFKAIDADPHQAAGQMIKLALFSGMRRSEMFRLTWSNVNFDREFILLVDTKSGRDKVIPMNQGARSVLESIPKTEGSDFVFPGRDGKQRTDLKRALGRIRRAAGLDPGFRMLHGMRHTFASGLASSGKVSLHEIQKLLTHADPRTTLRYSHLRDEALRKASDLAGELIQGAVEERKATVEND